MPPADQTREMGGVDSDLGAALQLAQYVITGDVVPLMMYVFILPAGVALIRRPVDQETSLTATDCLRLRPIRRRPRRGMPRSLDT